MATIGSRDTIEAFRQGAVDGVFTMDRETAQRCADHVAGLIERLQEHRRRIAIASQRVPSTLASEEQMNTGFANKFGEAGDFLDEYMLAGERLRQSFLIAGKILTEQDQDFAQQLTAEQHRLEDGER